MKTFKEFLNEAKAKFKVGDKVKEVEPMGQFKPGQTLEIVQIKSGRIGVVALGQNPKEVLFDEPSNFKLVEFKVGDRVKEVVPMGQFKPGETLEIVQIKGGRIGVIAQGQNPKDALFDKPSNFKFA